MPYLASKNHIQFGHFFDGQELFSTNNRAGPVTDGFLVKNTPKLSLGGIIVLFINLLFF